MYLFTIMRTFCVNCVRWMNNYVHSIVSLIIQVAFFSRKLYPWKSYRHVRPFMCRTPLHHSDRSSCFGMAGSNQGKQF